MRRRMVEADMAVVEAMTNDGRSADEIAGRIGCSPSTVVRARERLRSEGRIPAKSFTRSQGQLCRSARAQQDPLVLLRAEGPENADPERKLWCAVILQALRDLAAGRIVAGQPGEYLRARARTWIGSYPSRDFREVCWHAGFDPDVWHPRLRAFVDMEPEAIRARLRVAGVE